jgi:hypothetical protein
MKYYLKFDTAIWCGHKEGWLGGEEGNWLKHAMDAVELAMVLLSEYGKEGGPERERFEIIPWNLR